MTVSQGNPTSSALENYIIISIPTTPDAAGSSAETAGSGVTAKADKT